MYDVEGNHYGIVRQDDHLVLVKTDRIGDDFELARILLDDLTEQQVRYWLEDIAQHICWAMQDRHERLW